jgi:hypothetical protein
LIPELIALSPWIKIVIMTACATVDSAVETPKRGAIDYFTKPFDLPQMNGMSDILAAQIAAHSQNGSACQVTGRSSTDFTDGSGNSLETAEEIWNLGIRFEYCTMWVHPNHCRGRKNFKFLVANRMNQAIVLTGRIRHVRHPSKAILCED